MHWTSLQPPPPPPPSAPLHLQAYACCTGLVDSSCSTLPSTRLQYKLGHVQQTLSYLQTTSNAQGTSHAIPTGNSKGSSGRLLPCRPSHQEQALTCHDNEHAQLCFRGQKPAGKSCEASCHLRKLGRSKALEHDEPLCRLAQTSAAERYTFRTTTVEQRQVWPALVMLSSSIYRPAGDQPGRTVG